MIFLLVAAALVVGAPLAAAILVSFASRREDAEHTLTGRPPGPVTAIARRLLCSPTDARRTATGRRTATRGPVAGSARPANGRRTATRAPVAGNTRPANGARASRTGPELPRPRVASGAQADSRPSASARTDTLTLPRT